MTSGLARAVTLLGMAASAATFGCTTAPPPSRDDPPAGPSAATTGELTTKPPEVPVAPTAAVPTATALSATPLSASRMARTKNITLVVGESTRRAADDALPLVTITKTELLVQNEVIAHVNAGPLGFDAAVKREGQRAALQVLPLDAALRSMHFEDPSHDTVRLLFDAATSYRSALETMFSAAQAGFTSFEIIVQSRAGERALPASTPSAAERAAVRVPGAVPWPAFVIDAEGVSISVGETALGAGCVRGGAGVAVPRVLGAVDARAVATCAARLKTLVPASAALVTANVSAAPGIDVQSVLRVVAAIIPVYATVHFGLLS